MIHIYAINQLVSLRYSNSFTFYTTGVNFMGRCTCENVIFDMKIKFNCFFVFEDKKKQGNSINFFPSYFHSPTEGGL